MDDDDNQRPATHWNVSMAIRFLYKHFAFYLIVSDDPLRGLNNFHVKRIFQFRNGMAYMITMIEMIEELVK